jgi:hypothetical protein
MYNIKNRFASVSIGQACAVMPGMASLSRKELASLIIFTSDEASKLDLARERTVLRKTKLVLMGKKDPC